MREFYIFQIKEDLLALFKDNPYELFHTLETIYYNMYGNISSSKVFLESILKPFKKENFNNYIYSKYKDNYFYTKYLDTHKIYDIYKKENSVLKVYNTYLKISSDVIVPTFFKDINKKSNIFVCDFKNTDYFWLNSLKTLSL